MCNKKCQIDIFFLTFLFLTLAEGGRDKELMGFQQCVERPRNVPALIFIRHLYEHSFDSASHAYATFKQINLKLLFFSTFRRMTTNPSPTDYPSNSGLGRGEPL